MARFGRAMLDHWGLEPGLTYLNHGTVGATPRRVLARQQALRDEMERQPARFLLRECVGQVGAAPIQPSRMRAAAADVAAFVGARADDLVFVDNATTGVNAVLRSLDLRPGDEIVVSDHSYGAVTYTAQYVARRTGAVVRTAALPLPLRSPDDAVAAFAAVLGPRTRLAIVDHVCSGSAYVLPLAAIAARCRAAGVGVLADGAHAPGAIALDIAALGVDWYTANLHKWAWAPRGTGILWAAPDRQAGLHPPVISWGLDEGFAAEFDWVGTRDPSGWLAAPEAIAMLHDLGAADVRAYDHALALEAAERLADGIGAEPIAPPEMTGTMVTLRLPPRFGATMDDATRLRDALLFEHRIEVQVHGERGAVWVRVSAQVYNDADDLDRLVRALVARPPA